MTDHPPLPRFGWGHQLAAARSAAARRRRFLLVTSIATGCAALALPGLTNPAPHLIWNASPSVPIGLYRLSPGTAPRRGDLVVVHLPEPARGLAAVRHYLPAGVPLMKRAAALAGDRVCALNASLSINGTRRAIRLSRDAANRALPWWTGCRTLRSDEVLLLATDRPDSFDGRYFGPVSTANIIGTARRLWVR